MASSKLTGILVQPHVILNDGEDAGRVGGEGSSREGEVGGRVGDFDALR